jgi:carbon-monoxide dehydrogenase small subunit
MGPALAVAIDSASAREDPQVVAGAAARLQGDWKPQVEFRQSFVIAHPVKDVWAFFGRVEDVATCLPGASIDGGEKDGAVNGKMKVKVGPVVAEFSGVAYITRDVEMRRGTVLGFGRHTRSNSATRGIITYSIRPDERGASSRVDVDVGYTLTGMLAQFSRSSLAQDLAGRLTAAFAQNLEARLSVGNDGTEAPPMIRELNAGPLMITILLGRVRDFFRRFFGRS